MKTSAYFIIFGALLALIVLIVGGAFFGGPWGHAALAVGIIGMVAWIIFGIWLANAMDTDI